MTLSDWELIAFEKQPSTATVKCLNHILTEDGLIPVKFEFVFEAPPGEVWQRDTMEHVDSSIGAITGGTFDDICWLSVSEHIAQGTDLENHSIRMQFTIAERDPDDIDIDEEFDES